MAIKKISEKSAPVSGPEGQVYLAAGAAVALRLWDEPPGEGAASRRDYETVGYVLEGRAVLELMGSQVELSPGDSWLVPRGAEHRYRIRERLRAIEATAPPARADAGDVGDRPEPR